MNKRYQRLFIASNNQGKISEMSSLLSKLNIEAISPLNFNLQEPEENGEDFEKNAFIKAKYYAQQANLVALADDSGLCIEALDNQPGIHSARFAIDKNGQKNFPLAFEKIFEQLKIRGIESSDKAKAFFICTLCLYDPKNNFSKNFIGRVDGNINFQPLGNNGFGYDPIFIKTGMTQTFGEISADQKEQISHRQLAFTKFKTWLEE
jgi:XTP/dITP diphosphohydrolase